MRFLPASIVLTFALSACGGGGGGTDEPTTPSSETPTVETPVTETPTTESPVVEVPVTEIPATPNTAPTVDAGRDLVVIAGDFFSFDATITDAETPYYLQDIHWEQISGTDARSFFTSMEDGSFFAPDLTSEPETLTFRVTVIDEGGLSASDTVSVKVKPIVPVGGPITQDTTWSDDRVYFVNQNLSVRSGATLTIEAGAVVQVHHDDVDFLVQGTLKAEGTYDETNGVKPVVFTNSDEDNCCDFSWTGIEVLEGGKVDMIYALIEKGTWGLKVDKGASSTIGRILFRDNFYAFDGSSTRRGLKNSYNSYYRNYTALDFMLDGESEIHHNYFIENERVFVSYFGSKNPFSIHNNNFVDNEFVFEAQEINDYLSPGQPSFYNNWWGTTDSTEINKLIKDNQDDPRLMSVSVSPSNEFLVYSWGGIPLDYDWKDHVE